MDSDQQVVNIELSPFGWWVHHPGAGVDKSGNAFSNLNTPKRRVGGAIVVDLKPMLVPKIAYLPLR